MMVKKTWRNRLTALISTANRYSHASPDILADVDVSPEGSVKHALLASSLVYGSLDAQRLQSANLRHRGPSSKGGRARVRVWGL